MGIDNYGGIVLKPGARLHYGLSNDSTIFLGSFVTAGTGGSRDVSGTMEIGDGINPAIVADSSATVKYDKSFGAGLEVGYKKFNAFDVSGLTMSLGVEGAMTNKYGTVSNHSTTSTNPNAGAIADYSDENFKYNNTEKALNFVISVGYKF